MFYNFATLFTRLSLITVIIPVIPQQKIAQIVASHIMTLSAIGEVLTLVGSAEPESNDCGQAVLDMQHDLDRIGDITSGHMDWYIAYKNVIAKYAKILPAPATAYDFYTEDEIYLIQRVVETECFDSDFDSKCHVSNVILNLIEDPDQRYGSTVEKVVTSDNHFAYGRNIISDSTSLAVEYAFDLVAPTNVWIGFPSNSKAKTFNKWNYAFTDQIGQHFYSDEEKY